jgi:predicted nucleic acid-binding protein
VSLTSGSAGALLLDTSAAIGLAVADHEHHEVAAEALIGRKLGLAGHAAFETLSVLTRLPPPARLTLDAAGRLIARNFPCTRFLSAQAASQLLASLPAHGIAGGAVYDALVGAAALEHGLRLITLDRRAADTYRELGAEVEFLL